MRYGIFGGTFDPFTLAHYNIVKEVLEQKLVDEVIVLPTIVDYYRNDDHLFSHEERLKIIGEWFGGQIGVIIDPYEYEYAKRHTPGECQSRRYIHMLCDTIDRYGAKDTEGNDNSFYTIIGSDSLKNFKTWTEWEGILEKSELIVVQRGDESEMKTDLRYIRCETDREKVEGISATLIRKSLIDDCSGMGMGPNATPFNLYMDDIRTMKNEKAVKLDLSELKNTIDRLLTERNAPKILLKTRIFDVVSQSEVKKGFRPVQIHSNDWVTVIVERNGQFLMEKQFRYGLNAVVEEFPCGIVESGENPVDAAQRELKEETGFDVDVDDMVYIGKYAANPAFMTNYMHYFYIRLDHANYRHGEQELDSNEELEYFWKDKDAVVESVEGNPNGFQPALLGCAMWQLHLKGII